MMRPIPRIPTNGTPIAVTVHSELESLGIGNSNASNSLAELLSHCDGDNDHLQNCMDWAMQIRAELGIDWGSAIEAAMILYFG